MSQFEIAIIDYSSNEPSVAKPIKQTNEPATERGSSGVPSNSANK